ncbi:MAG TPA: hypothetical protein VEW93_05855 [Acidimicrobiales bacterium]|nr:hypothetical protein [Acidimicrobiales bacterium]
MKLRRLLGRDDPGDGDATGPADADGDDVARVVGGADDLDDAGPDDRGGPAATGAEESTGSADGSAPTGGATAAVAEAGAEAVDGDPGAGGTEEIEGAEGATAEDVEAVEATDEDADEGAADEDADEDGAEGATAGPDGEGEDEDDGPGQMAFELADWGARERKLLDDQLGALGVPRAWEASTLVVDASNADAVDDLIDEIEERTALDLAPGVEPVTYEVGDWPLGLEDRFIEALIEARIPHQRGYREIAVGVDDEEQVDALIEALTAAWEDEQPTEEELDGPDAQQVLSELFVSADRLLHDATDRPATVRFDDAAGSVAEMGLPFGFAPGDWDDVVARVADLRTLLSEAESTDEQITEAARDLRTRLRPLV